MKSGGHWHDLPAHFCLKWIRRFARYLRVLVRHEKIKQAEYREAVRISKWSQVCIPDKLNFKTKHSFDAALYKGRNLIERFFLLFYLTRQLFTFNLPTAPSKGKVWLGLFRRKMPRSVFFFLVCLSYARNTAVTACFFLRALWWATGVERLDRCYSCSTGRPGRVWTVFNARSVPKNYPTLLFKNFFCYAKTITEWQDFFSFHPHSWSKGLSRRIIG